MIFTVVIPCRLYSETLKKTLFKLQNQKFKDYEVLVVLDAEDEFDEFYNTRFLTSGVVSPGEKRNIGIKEAKGEFVAFLDDDAYPNEDWLENAYQIFRENEDFIGVCGPSITPHESTFLEVISGYVFESFMTSGPTVYRHKISKERFVDDYPSVNLIVKKFCLIEIGGFDKNFWPGEDTKLCRDLVLRFKKKLFYSPKLVVHHFRRNMFHPHLIQVSRYAFHRGLFIKLFPENSLRITYFIPSLFFLYFLALLPMFFYQSQLFYYSLIPMILYLSILLVEGTRVFKKSRSIITSISTVIGIFLSNLVYGSYFIKGLISKPKLALREVDMENKKYIKG